MARLTQRIAAGALVVEDDRLLLVHHLLPGIHDFWVPPGGGVQDREEVARAAAREVLEETALAVEVERLAYIDDLVISGTRQCKFWFLARRTGGEIDVTAPAARAEHIVEAAFLSQGQMRGKLVFPEVVREDFWRHREAGFAALRFLGVRDAVIAAPPALEGAPKPRSVGIGVGVLVVREGKVLLGRRRGSHGAGTWSAPGGKLDYGESIEHCARRELAEETGLELGPAELGPYTNDVFTDGPHYVTALVIARGAMGEPRVMEPDKCEGWAWFAWDQLPAPLFLPLANAKRMGFDPRLGGKA